MQSSRVLQNTCMKLPRRLCWPFGSLLIWLDLEIMLVQGNLGYLRNLFCFLVYLPTESSVRVFSMHLTLVSWRHIKSVVSHLRYLHSLHVVYRDLKPEILGCTSEGRPSNCSVSPASDCRAFRGNCKMNDRYLIEVLEPHPSWDTSMQSFTSMRQILTVSLTCLGVIDESSNRADRDPA